MGVVIRLLSLLKGYQKWVIMAIFLGWATVISWIALISTSAYLISYAALHPSVAELQVAIVGVRFFGIARGIFRYLERMVSHTITFKLLARLRVWFYNAIEPLAPANLIENKSGDMVSRMVGDIETLQEFYVRVVAPPVVALFTGIGVLWFFGRLDQKFALTLLSFQICTGVLIPILILIISKNPAKRLIASRGSLQALLLDGLQGGGEIVVNNQEHNYLNIIRSLGDEFASSQREMNFIQGLHIAIIVLLVNIVVVVMLIQGIPLVINGSLDGRLLAVVILGALASFEAILPLPQAFQNLGVSFEAGRRIFDLFWDEKIPVCEKQRLTDLAISSIEFKDVGFSYSHQGGKILENIDFEITPGKKIAIVGLNGAGKSSIFNILLRYWDYGKGEIVINGHDLRSIKEDDVRKLIALVNQKPFFFNTTITENLKIAKPNANSDEIIMATTLSLIHDEILTFPDGYDTRIGNEGFNLSGGQRQRLAIARAILKGSPLLCLDEPTVNLDPILSEKVIRSIIKFFNEKSLILATHDLTGLDQMDEILVLHCGKILERGNHAELLEINGYFTQMFRNEREFFPKV